MIRCMSVMSIPLLRRTRVLHQEVPPVCRQVPRLQNQSGGTLLLQFYRTQRIIVNDKYKMAIA